MGRRDSRPFHPGDNGWLILLGRGLDIFQRSPGNQYDLAVRHQQFRQVAGFGITYIHEKP